MHSVCYIWVYKAVCVCVERLLWGQTGYINRAAHLGNRQKGLVKRLIRPGQAAHIKT